MTEMPHFDKAAEKANHLDARATLADRWVAAGGGDEEPFLSRDGRWTLYVFNYFTLQHGWLDMATDIVTED